VACGRFRADEVEAEAGAQLARLQGSKIEVSHFDSHKHTHMFPSLLQPLLRAASAHGVTAVRNPFEAPGVVGFRDARASKTLLVRKAETALLRMLLYRRWLRAVRVAGFSTTDGSLGVATTGTLDEPRLRAMLKRMPPGTWELVCHPGYNDGALAAVRTRLRESREVEMKALLAITPSELSNEYGAELAPFRAKSWRPARIMNI
jgi:chitin disaccharide deacetylase